MPDLPLVNAFHLPSRRVSRRWTRSGTNLVIFLETLCRQTSLLWCEIKINKMYPEKIINIRKFCPTAIGCYYWNIPLSTREKTTKKLFKRALFNYYLAQY